MTGKSARWSIIFALLGSAASDVAATGACADELEVLRSQIEDLEARAPTTEAESGSPSTSEGRSSTGDVQGVYSTAPERMRDRITTDSGTTLFALPAAPGAPSVELSISGETRFLLSTKSRH